MFDIFTHPQQPITKEFISVLLSNDLPAAFRGSAVTQEKTPGSLLLLRLTFLGASADDPVLAGMIRRFPDVETTMLFGTLDQIILLQQAGRNPHDQICESLELFARVRSALRRYTQLGGLPAVGEDDRIWRAGGLEVDDDRKAVSVDGVPVALTALEFLVAFLQAFVFAVLTCIYLNDVVNLDHAH